MPLDPEKLLALQVPDVEHSYGPRDCILYALGVGLGQDPVNEDELAFVYEKNLKVLPTFAVTQAYTAYFLRRPELGVTWSHVVHGEQGLILHRPVKPEGTVVGRTRILDVVDKGADKGALVYTERTIIDKASGALLGDRQPQRVLPRRRRLRRAEARHAAAARLAGARARRGGRSADAAGNGADLPAFRRRQRAACRSRQPPAPPASRARSCMGLPPSAWRGMPCCKDVCGYDPARLTAMAGRFSAPVYPGETIRTEIWRDGGVVELPRPRRRARRGGDRPRPRGGEVTMAKADHSHEDHADIREGVRALCAKFPGEYWRALDRERAYPTEFVAALTEAGYLAALIPEEFGGSGLGIGAAAAILEEIHAAGGNGAACHAQMYIMGTILRHGSPAQKEDYLPRIASGELRLQAFGVTEPTSGTDTLALRTTARKRRRPLRHQRPEDLDLARRAFRPDAAARAHHAARTGAKAHRRPVGVPGRHAAGARHRA